MQPPKRLLAAVALVSAAAAIPIASAHAAPWHLDAVQPAPPSGGATLVALLDGRVAAVPTLGDPLGWIDPEEMPDHHPHFRATHVASTVASTAGQAGPHPFQGAAPGVDLLPLSVLDALDLPSEPLLVDALHQAIAAGADVIHMSVSFPPDHLPSRDLREALQAAHDAGIVLVAPAGDAGLDQVSWPAASPHVIAVAAAQPAASGLTLAGYSNASAAIDVVAPGGNLAADVDQDGLPDGILAETVDPASGAPAPWLFASSAHAAAVVSGLVVEPLASGVAGVDVPLLLQQQSTGADPSDWHLGAGFVSMQGGVPPTSPPASERHAALLPFLKRTGLGLVAPAARVTVFDAVGQPVAGVEVVASVRGNLDGTRSCVTNPAGQCTVQGDSVLQALAGAWSFTVDAVVDSAGLHRPGTALTVNANLQNLVASLRSHPQRHDDLLGWAWSSGSDPALGSVAPAYAVADLDAGPTTTPSALLLSPLAATALGTLTLDLLGNLELATLDGILGLPGNPDVTFVEADGLAVAAHGGQGTFLALAEPAPAFAGSPLGDQLADGGWHVDGYAGASLLSSHAALGLGPSPLPGASSAGLGDTPAP